jgi:hypothetical protein
VLGNSIIDHTERAAPGFVEASVRCPEGERVRMGPPVATGPGARFRCAKRDMLSFRRRDHRTAPVSLPARSPLHPTATITFAQAYSISDDSAGVQHGTDEGGCCSFKHMHVQTCMRLCMRFNSMEHIQRAPQPTSVIRTQPIMMHITKAGTV